MDNIKFRKALGKLQAFIDYRPQGRVAERDVITYHSLLGDIASETGQNLDYFHIPDSELTKRVAREKVDDFGQLIENIYTDSRYCDESVFMTNLKGLVNFLNSFNETQPRKIGFQPKQTPPNRPPK